MTTVNQQYRKINPAGGTPREISEVVNNIMDGKTNNVGDFTTTPNSTTSTIYNERIGFNSAILFTPMNQSAATETSHLYVESLHKGYAVIRHRSNNNDDVFKYVVVG